MPVSCTATAAPSTPSRPSSRSTAPSIPDFKGIEEEQGLFPETQTGRIERLAKLYSGVRTPLAAVTTLPLIPAAWRAALAICTQALEALAATVPNANPDFKAGKDL